MWDTAAVITKFSPVAVPGSFQHGKTVSYVDEKDRYSNLEDASLDLVVLHV